MIRRRILWRNFPGRYWLWRHRNHAYRRLIKPTYSCSCGSTFTPKETPMREIPDVPAIDAGDEDPDLLAGDPTEAEHDLDIDAFTDEEDDQ